MREIKFRAWDKNPYGSKYAIINSGSYDAPKWQSNRFRTYEGKNGHR